MKLAIQIPCFNEEAVLGATLATLPDALDGIEHIFVIVIDDGSSDTTAAVARAHGVPTIVRFGRHRGLAEAFAAGLDASLDAGADIVVNFDADGQYRAADIPALIAPILRGEADIVIGERVNRHLIENRLKRALGIIGNRVVRLAAGLDVPDAASGFRAVSRSTACRLTTFNRFSYTTEMLIQAGHQGMTARFVPVTVNPPARPSRLMRNIFEYVWRTALVIVKTFVIYKPAATLGVVGCAPLALSGLFALIAWQAMDLKHFMVAVAVAATSATIASFIWTAGLLANLIAVNRRLIEECRLRLRDEVKSKETVGEP